MSSKFRLSAANPTRAPRLHVLAHLVEDPLQRLDVAGSEVPKEVLLYSAAMDVRALCSASSPFEVMKTRITRRHSSSTARSRPTSAGCSRWRTHGSPSSGARLQKLHTGQPQNEATHGGDFFTELYADDARLKQFLHAMTGLSAGTHKAIAANFPWERYSKLRRRRLR